MIDDQARNPPFGSNLTFPIEHYSRFHQTSGTTGQAHALARHTGELGLGGGVLDADFRTAGVGRTTVSSFLFRSVRFSDSGARSMRRTAWVASAIAGGGMRSTARLRTLLDNRVTAICSTPTYALHLAEVAAEENIDLSAATVRTIIVAGEPGGSIPATRSHIETAWGARTCSTITA